MKSISLKIFKALLFIEGALIIFSLVFFNIKILLNTQIGFLSSSLVMIASFLAYKRMVDARVELKMIPVDDSKDFIDKLEDPYDLYGEDLNGNENLTQVTKQERKNLKDHRSFYEMLQDTRAALSLYRLGAYIVLILGFLYLNRQGLLSIPIYIFSLSIPPLVMVVLLLKEKETP